MICMAEGGKKKELLKNFWTQCPEVGSVCLVLFIIRDKFHYILNPAVKDTAQAVQDHCLDHHIFTKPLELCFVYIVILDQPVLTDALFL